jgi:beta-phosphoglucomutase-like phosphatase (HAD superfamily)
VQVPTTTDLIIFDCDGVLIDSEPIATRVHARALSELGHDISAEEIIRRLRYASYGIRLIGSEHQLTGRKVLDPSRN